MSITVFDLGLGNLHSVTHAIARATGEAPQRTRDPDEVARADRLVVPGQGAFRDGAQALAGAPGEALRSFLASGRPYLGICLGMQLLFERSDEAEGAAGLGHFPGAVRGFELGRVVEGRVRKVPHMGWAPVRSEHPLIDGDGWFYFVHSYHCVPDDPALAVASADHGERFCAAVAEGPVFACQFHPEKSQRRGARLLERFASWS